MLQQVWSIVGGQAGSEGKGKAAGYLAAALKPEVVACAFTANAGHTAYDRDGNKIVVHTIPIGAFFGAKLVVIGPGAAIRTWRLIEEMEALHRVNPDCKVLLDENVVLISPEQVAWEAETMKKISSTCQGVGRAQADRLLRQGRADTASNHAPTFIEGLTVGSAAEVLQVRYDSGDKIQIEGCQGIDIDLLHGIQYPYCTSRSITAAAVANDCGFPATRVDSVVSVFRTYPIRVGNVVEEGKQVGWSGPIPRDSDELTWDEMTKLAGSPERLEERTTVTKKVRRIFTWSRQRYIVSQWLNNATHAWVNFGDYLDWNIHGVCGNTTELHSISKTAAQWVDTEIGMSHLLALGTGPGMDDVIAHPRLR